MDNAIYSLKFAEDMHKLHVSEFYLAKIFQAKPILCESPNGRSGEGTLNNCVFFYVVCGNESVRNLYNHSRDASEFSSAFVRYVGQLFGLSGDIYAIENRFGFKIASLFTSRNSSASGIYCPVELDSFSLTNLQKSTYIAQYTQRYSEYLCKSLSCVCTDCGRPFVLSNLPKGKAVTVSCKNCHRPNYIYVPLEFDSSPYPSSATTSTSGGNTDHYSAGYGETANRNNSVTSFVADNHSLNTSASSGSSTGGSRTIYIHRPQHAHRDLTGEMKLAAARNLIVDSIKVHAYLDDRDCGVLTHDDRLRIDMTTAPHTLRCGKIGKSFVIPAGNEDYDAIYFNKKLAIAPLGDPFITELTGHIIRMFRGRGIRDRMNNPNNKYQSINIRYESDRIVLFWTPIETHGFKQWASGYVEEPITYASMGLKSSPCDSSLLPENADYWDYIKEYVCGALINDDQADVEYTENGFSAKMIHSL